MSSSEADSVSWLESIGMKGEPVMPLGAVGAG